MTMLQPLAVFDFDDTLIEGDSLWAFLSYAGGGEFSLLTAFAEANARLVLDRLRGEAARRHVSPRTLLKEHLLRRLIAGKSCDSLGPAVERLRCWRKWKEPLRQALLDHHAKGHQVVIASGSLSLYMPRMIDDLPYHALICSDVAVVDGIVEGSMPNGNCVRERKAERVAVYMRKHGPFGESWGYGNAPHDLPMMELMTHRVVV
ncbi:MAG: HAD family hydrolase [Bdellovibrionales bacterium]